mgnify:CR=1 FL=1
MIPPGADIAELSADLAEYLEIEAKYPIALAGMVWASAHRALRAALNP